MASFEGLQFDDVKNSFATKCNEIENILEKRIKNDTVFEKNFQEGGKNNTKKEVLAWNRKLVDVQMKTLFDKLQEIQASESEIKEATGKLLGDIKKQVSQSLSASGMYKKAFGDILKQESSSFPMNRKYYIYEGPIDDNIAYEALTSIDMKLSIDARVQEVQARIKAKQDFIKKFHEISVPDLAKIGTVQELDEQYNAYLKNITPLIEEGDKLLLRINTSKFKKKYEAQKTSIQEQLEQKQKDLEEKRKIDEAEKLLNLREGVAINLGLFTRTLKAGDTGADVKELQKFLGIQEDGVFGNQTEYVLKAYQRRIGYIKPDGEITITSAKEYATLKAIKADVARLNPPKKEEISKKQIHNQKEENIKQEKKVRLVKKKEDDGKTQVSEEKDINTPKIKEKIYMKGSRSTFEESDTVQYFDGPNGLIGGKYNIEKAKKTINIDSFVQILKTTNGKSLGELIVQVRKIINTNNVTDNGYSFTPFNISELKNFFQKKGYESNGVFGGEEMGALISLLESFYITQRDIPKMSLRDKMGLLFDFDQNGKLQIDKNFYVGELQMNFQAFDSFTADEINILFAQLGLGTLASFSKEMSSNLVLAREKFQRAFGVMIERGITPTELMKKGGVKKANERIYEEREKGVQKISKEVDMYVDTKLSEIKKLQDKGVEGIADIEGIKKALKLQAVGLFVTPNALGAGASYNIEKLPLFFESLEIGVFLKNGVPIPGIAVSKRLLEKNGFHIDASILGIIPFISASYTLDRDIGEFKTLFPKKIDTKLGLSAYAGVGGMNSSLWAIGGGVSGNKINENTSKGIEKMVGQMGEVLKGISKDIQSGKSFDESSFGKASQDAKEDAKVYSEIKASYDTYAKGKSYEEAFLKDMMNGYLGYYETQLYNNAEGINVTSAGVGIALLAGFLPLPYLTLGGEKLGNKWDTVLHSVERQRDISRKKIDVSSLGIKEVSYKGKTVLSIPNTEYQYRISNSTGDTQLELSKGTLYIGGNITSFEIEEYVTHEGVQRVIVLGGGKKGKDGLYEATPIVNITDSIDRTLVGDQEFSNDLEAIKATQNIRENLFVLINTDTLNHPKTLGMQELQRMIFSYKNLGNPSLHMVWKKFEKVVTYSGFEEYTREKKNDSVLKALKENLKGVKTDSEKVLILQAIASNFMKKDALQNIDNDSAIEISQGRTIEEYDRQYGRAAYFDRQFGKKFPSLLPQIRKARAEWYQANGKAKEYMFTPVHDGSLAFTGVESRKADKTINISGILSYTGAYNIASIQGGKDFIDILGKSQDVIDNLPKRVLENIRHILSENAIQLKNTDEVKHFINRGGNKEVQLDYSLAFTRMGECLNDAVVIKNLKLVRDGKMIQIGATTVGEVYDPNHSVVSWGLAFAEKVEANSEENTSGNNQGGATPGSAEGGVSIPDTNGPNI